MLKIDLDLCVGCGRCIKVCPFGALTLKNEKAILDELVCTLCGACARPGLCPEDAITLERKVVDPSQFVNYKNVWIYAEQDKGVLKPVVLELLGEGRKLADQIEQKLVAIVLGKDVGEIPKDLAEHGADQIIVAEHDALEHYTTDAYTTVLAGLIEKGKPSILLFGATMNGRDLAPRLAARLRLGLTADCTGLSIDEKGQLVQTRPAFGGNIMASILSPETRPQMATVRSNVFKKAVQKPGTTAPIERFEVKISPLAIRTRVKETVREVSEDTLSVHEADVVVSVGRGIASPDNISLAEELAQELNAAVGGSRPIVDQGWMSHHQQVGQSGRTICPKLYIALGISGQVQHYVGCSEAERIIAVNEDPKAPIFEFADVGIVGDLFKVVPALIEAIRKAQAKE
jgi:electron transfer flavoprotein alpha subunit/NAD-dependent dihydropyrimidine dehydrogenase PreA subunit